MRRKHFIFYLFILVAGCGKSSSSGGSGTTPPPVASTFTNPLLSSGPDPYVIGKDGFYYYTHTQGNKISLWKTAKMNKLGSVSPVTVFSPPVNGPNAFNIWAPELHFINNKWYLYYAAGSSADESTQRTFVLENTSADPTQGVWTDRGRIFNPSEDFWAIDGTVLQYNGNNYFLWSGQPAMGNTEQRIYISQMSDPWTLTGARVQLSAPVYDWETVGSGVLPKVNEGPEILQNAAGRVFLIYSASGCWTDDYTLGMLTLKDSGNPLTATDWTKNPTPVFVKAPDNGAYGPGHNGFFKSVDGTQDWIIYHANSQAGQGCGDERNPRMQSFTWNTDGTPNFGTPVKINTAITVPSGE